MANIILNVDLNSSKAKMGLSELEKATQTIAKSLQEVSVNKNLTSQINATARYYNSIAKAAKEATIATRHGRYDIVTTSYSQVNLVSVAQRQLTEETYGTLLRLVF